MLVTLKGSVSNFFLLLTWLRFFKRKAFIEHTLPLTEVTNFFTGGERGSQLG